VAVAANNGPTAKIAVSNGEIDLKDAWVDDHTLNISSSAGNATVSSPGPTNVTLDRLSGEWSNVSSLDVDQHHLTVDPENNREIIVGGETDALAWRGVTVDDGEADFVYSGSSGSTTLTISGVTPDETVLAIDSHTGQALDSATPDANNQLTLTMPNSEHTVELVTSDGAPGLADPRPEGDRSDFPTELAVNVSDPDFPQDNVTVEFYLDGSKVGEKTTDSAGEVILSISQPSRGDHDARAVATDSFGQTSQLTWSFGVPNRLYIRNVTNASELVDGQEVTVDIYQQDDNVTTRTTTNGSISLAGLDEEGDIIVTAEAPGTASAPAYQPRTYIVEDLSRQDAIYLLPENKTSTTVRFTLDDPSGAYGPQSFLYIQRAVNESGNISWITVTGDEFGAAGVDATLESNERYRLRITNGEQTAQMGSYVAPNATSDLVSLRPDSPAVSLNDTETVTVNASVDDSGTLHIDYVDPEKETDRITIVAVNRFNGSDVIYGPQSYYGQQTVSITEPVGQLNDSYLVRVSGVRDGQTFNTTAYIGPEQQSIVPPGLSGVWIQVAGIGLLLIVGGLFSQFNVSVGAVVTSLFAGVLWYIGLLQGVASWASVALAITFSVLYGLVVNR
jgi:hypothetical protein